MLRVIVLASLPALPDVVAEVYLQGGLSREAYSVRAVDVLPDEEPRFHCVVRPADLPHIRLAEISEVQKKSPRLLLFRPSGYEMHRLRGQNAGKCIRLRA